MKLNKVIFLFFVLIAFFFLYAYSLNQYENKIFYSSDELINLHISEVYYKTQQFYFIEGLNDNLDYKIIHPRQIFPYGGKLVPILPVGGYLLWGTLMIFSLNFIIKFFVPLISILTLLFLFILIKNTFDKKTALFSCLLTGIIAPFWFFSSSIFVTDILWIFFSMVGTFFAFKIKSVKSKIHIFLSSFFFAFAILVNYKAIFWIFSISLAWMITFKKDSIRILIKKYYLIILGILTPVLVLFYSNKILYGGIFTTGYGAVEKYSLSISGPGFSLLYLELPKMLFNLYNYLLYIPLFIILSLVGLAYVAKQNNARLRLLFWTVLFYGLIIIFYLSNIASAGTDFFSIQSSFFRYLLPLFLFSGPLLFFGLKTLTKPSKVLFIFFFIIVNVFLMAHSNGGIAYYRNYESSSLDFSEKILSNTEQNSIIITSYYDKILFPKRKIADISLITSEGALVGKEIDLIKVVNTISKIDSPLYFIDRGEFNIDDLREELNLRGFKIENVRGLPELYKITLKNETAN